MARYLIDANLPRWFSLWSGGDCEFVHDLGADWSDTEIWEYASANSLTIVSKDADFSDRVLASAAGPKVGRRRRRRGKPSFREPIAPWILGTSPRMTCVARLPLQIDQRWVRLWMWAGVYALEPRGLHRGRALNCHPRTWSEDPEFRGGRARGQGRHLAASGTSRSNVDWSARSG